MKKLFLCILALTTGALAFVSCDNEKDNLKDDSTKERQKYENVLSYDRQQDILSKSLNAVAQIIDFTSLGQAVQGVMAEYGDTTINFEALLGAIAAQDEILGGRINAIREILSAQQDVCFDFSDLYFEANLDFKPDTILVPDGAGGFKDSIIIMPVISDAMYEDVDHAKLNIGFKDKQEKLIIVLKGHNDVESRVSFTDTISKQVRNITLPDTLDLSVTMGRNTVLLANIAYKTDFQAQVEGTGSIIRKEVAGVKPDKFKLTKLVLNGEELSLNAGITLDKYSIKANVDYDKENGLNIDAKAQLLGIDMLSVRAKVDATLNKDMDWTDIVGSVLPWISDNFDRKARGAQVEAVLGSDDIKLLTSVDFTDNELLTAVSAFLISRPNTDTDMESVNRLLGYLNSRVKGELYFKGYNGPQAKIRFIYDAESAGEIQEIDFKKIKTDALLNNLKNSGLRVMIDTYDSEGYAVTLSFQEYFDAIDFKALGNTIVSKFKSAVGSQVSNKLLIPRGGKLKVRV